jgi:TolB-like protein
MPEPMMMTYGQRRRCGSCREDRVRIGIKAGDRHTQGEDIFGRDGTAAARREDAAGSAGSCVSGRVPGQVEGKLDPVFEDAGDRQPEIIAWPVRLYTGGLNPEAPRPEPALILPDKPSIAVLPFENVSEGPAQQYFADGKVDEIIAALSPIRWLFVIARNFSFAYKDKKVQVKQVGSELGVRYALEGSVHRLASRVRIAGRLLEAGTGTQLWAGAFEGDPEDIYALQYQVGECVVGQIAPELERAEIERAKRKPTDRLDAYDVFLRGMAYFHQQTRETNDEALRPFYNAIGLDREFALPEEALT